jgi:hypothetical protein
VGDGLKEASGNSESRTDDDGGRDAGQSPLEYDSRCQVAGRARQYLHEVAERNDEIPGHRADHGQNREQKEKGKVHRRRA